MKKIETQNNLLWRGHFKVEQTNGFSFGFFWGVGKNTNKGKIIEFTFDEDERILVKIVRILISIL